MATIGFDVEFLVKDTKTENIVPVCGKVGGTKENHIKLGEWEVHEDNVCLEVNSPVFTGADDAETWFDNLWNIRNPLRRRGLDLCTNSDYCNFTDEELQSAGAQAQEIGCDPDIDAYGKEQVERQVQFNGNVRTAGAHIHLGYSTHDKIPHEYVAQMMDMVACGVPVPANSHRLKVYGPGIYRKKPYGLEYRSLGAMSIISGDIRWPLIKAAYTLASMMENEPQTCAEIYSQLDFAKVKDHYCLLKRPKNSLYHKIRKIWPTFNGMGREARYVLAGNPYRARR